MVEVYRGDTCVQAQTPGSWDAIVFERRDSVAQGSAGILHFGFRLLRPESTSALAGAIERAGGTIVDQGEFCPGEPYVFFLDPDGYEVEVWHERPTPFDPVDTSRVPKAEGTDRECKGTNGRACVTCVSHPAVNGGGLDAMRRDRFTAGRTHPVRRRLPGAAKTTTTPRR